MPLFQVALCVGLALSGVLIGRIAGPWTVASLGRELLSGREVVVRSGLAIAATTGLLFAVSGITHREWFLAFDEALLERSVLAHDSWLTAPITVVTFLGDVEPGILLAVLGGSLLAYYRKGLCWLLPFLLPGSIVLELRIQGVVSNFDGRPQPPQEWAIGPAGTYPSGGVARTLLVLGLLAVLMSDHWRSPEDHRFLGALVGACVGMVAASRVLLGRHWFADLIGGLVLGWGMLMAMAPMLRWRNMGLRNAGLSMQAD